MNQKHKGSYCELLVCTWLLKKGYEVFLNVSSHGEADLVAWIPGERKPTFVDVTTAMVYQSKSGKNKLNYSKEKDRNDYGILVIVVDIEKEKCYWSKDLPDEQE